MKNYELIAKLMELPAGYDISLIAYVTKQDLLERDEMFVTRDIEAINTNETTKSIDFSA